jgi:hypothetical protein
VIEWTYVTLIVPNSVVEDARSLAASLGPQGMGLNMYRVPVSPSGELPATHFISSGHVDARYVAVLDAKDAAAILGLAKQTDPTVTMSLSRVQEILAGSLVVHASLADALSQHGLQMIPDGE